jgi:hypothetical protein
MLPSDDAPRIAQEALEHGYDGVATRKLAGLIRPIWSELNTLVPEFLTELGAAEALNEEDAGRLLAREVAKAIADGRVAPYDGARFLWREINIKLWPNGPSDLLPFVGLASEYEDCEYYGGNTKAIRAELAHQIVEQAREFIASQMGNPQR